MSVPLTSKHVRSGFTPDPDLSDSALYVLRLLDRYYNERPVTAAKIADTLGLNGTTKRETKRRRIRSVVLELRGKGFRVCGAGDGYWMGRNDGEYGEYLNAVRSRARYRFKTARRMGETASDRATGQGVLFPMELALR